MHMIKEDVSQILIYMKIIVDEYMFTLTMVVVKKCLI